MKEQSFNVYQMVTDRIVAEMEKGIIPWHKPWTGVAGDGGAINYDSRKPYSLLNQIVLGEAGEYLTFNQIKAHKGSIKKGAKSRPVVYFQWLERVKKNDNGEEEIERIPFLRYYNVFHIKDTEGIASKTSEKAPDKHIDPIVCAEQVISAYVERETELKFKNDAPSSKAYYSPVKDMVVVPMINQYKMAEEYYSTTFHELVHSTAKESRCNRDTNPVAFFGSEDYSREELVAELGSAMLCNRIGIECEKAFKNSVAYLQSWLKALKNDNRMIVWAASRAEKASKYILAEQGA